MSSCMGMWVVCGISGWCRPPSLIRLHGWNISLYVVQVLWRMGWCLYRSGWEVRWVSISWDGHYWHRLSKWVHAQVG